MPLRGNVTTRVDKVLAQGKLDAALLACAGLARLGLEGKIVLLFVGRLHPVKDPFTLVRAVASLSRPNVCLVIVGEGPLADQTRSLAMSLGVEVKFISRVSTPSLIRIYQASDVFVLPSISEAAGLVLIEAMACGLPIVASAIEGIPEIVGDVGLLVGPGDHACVRGGLRSAALPNLRLFDATLNPEREQRRQHANEKHRTPAPARQDEPGDDRRRAVADRPRTLDEPQRLAAVLRGKILGHEGRAAAPFAAHCFTLV